LPAIGGCDVTIRCGVTSCLSGAGAGGASGFAAFTAVFGEGFADGPGVVAIAGAATVST
jgi:hypothetical protein